MYTGFTSFRGNEACHLCGDCCGAADFRLVSIDSIRTEACPGCAAEVCLGFGAEVCLGFGAVEACSGSIAEASIVVAEACPEEHRCWDASEQVPPWNHVSIIDFS